MLERMLGFLSRFFSRLKEIGGEGDEFMGSKLEHLLRGAPHALPVWIRMFVKAVEHISSHLLLTFPTIEDFYVALTIVEPLNGILVNTKQLMIALL